MYGHIGFNLTPVLNSRLSLVITHTPENVMKLIQLFMNLTRSRIVMRNLEKFATSNMRILPQMQRLKNARLHLDRTAIGMLSEKNLYPLNL